MSSQQQQRKIKNQRIKNFTTQYPDLEFILKYNFRDYTFKKEIKEYDVNVQTIDKRIPIVCFDTMMNVTRILDYFYLEKRPLNFSNFPGDPSLNSYYKLSLQDLNNIGFSKGYTLNGVIHPVDYIPTSLKNDFQNIDNRVINHCHCYIQKLCLFPSKKKEGESQKFLVGIHFEFSLHLAYGKNQPSQKQQRHKRDDLDHLQETLKFIIIFPHIYECQDNRWVLFGDTVIYDSYILYLVNKWNYTNSTVNILDQIHKIF